MCPREERQVVWVCLVATLIDFGRDVKSPGRPRKVEPDDTSLVATQEVVDKFLRSNVMKYIKVQHELAMDTTKDPKVRLAAAQKLTDRAIGPVVEHKQKDENALVGLIRELIGLRPNPPVVNGEFEVVVPKELPSGEPQPA